MNYLKNKRAYLSGPIEADTGPNWREPVKKALTEKFGIDLFDPFTDPKQQWAPLLNQAKNDQNFDLVTTIAKSFVRKDLCMVDRSDLLIAYLPKSICTTGTVHEIINSVNSKKPVLLVTNGPKTQIPSWYWGFIPHEVMFSSFDELYEYLIKVDRGDMKDNNRWAYIYGLV